MIELSTSSYYYRPKVARATRDQDDADLGGLIEDIQGTFPKALDTGT